METGYEIFAVIRSCSQVILEPIFEKQTWKNVCETHIRCEKIDLQNDFHIPNGLDFCHWGCHHIVSKVFASNLSVTSSKLSLRSRRSATRSCGCLILGSHRQIDFVIFQHFLIFVARTYVWTNNYFSSIDNFNYLCRLVYLCIFRSTSWNKKTSENLRN